MDSISILSMHFCVFESLFIQVCIGERRGGNVPNVAFLVDYEIERGMRFVFTSASPFRK